MTNIKKKMTGLSACMLSITLATCTLGGCNQAVETWAPVGGGNTIKIALLGPQEDFEYDTGILDGMNMAAKEIQESTGWTVEFESYNDDGEYNKGVMLASQIAADNSITATITVQDFDILNTIASIYDKAQKPLFVTQGCYDSTSGAGYSSVIFDCVTADATGKIMGNFALEHGYQNIAYCHTDTTFEKDELKGFQSIISSGTNTRIADAMTGPFTQEEFDIAYARWQLLNIDAICISFYSQTLGCELIKMLREAGSDIPVIVDYGIVNDDNIEQYSQYFNNLYVTSHYPCTESDLLDDFNERFSAEYGYLPSAYAVQSYDLINIIVQTCQSGAATTSDMMSYIKSPEGFDTVSGHIAFDNNGILEINTYDDISTFNKDHFETYNSTRSEN